MLEEILEDCLKLYTSLTPGLAGFLSKFVVWVEIRVSRKSGGKKKAKSPYVAANSYIKNAHTVTMVHKQMLIQKMHVKTI